MLYVFLRIQRRRVHAQQTAGRRLVAAGCFKRGNEIDLDRRTCRKIIPRPMSAPIRCWLRRARARGPRPDADLGTQHSRVTSLPGAITTARSMAFPTRVRSGPGIAFHHDKTSGASRFRVLRARFSSLYLRMKCWASGKMSSGGRQRRQFDRHHRRR